MRPAEEHNPGSAGCHLQYFPEPKQLVRGHRGQGRKGG